MIGYLLGRYPTVSHTFVYREIAALKRMGSPLSLFALERTGDPDHAILPAREIASVPTAHAVIRRLPVPAEVARA